MIFKCCQQDDCLVVEFDGPVREVHEAMARLIKKPTILVKERSHTSGTPTLYVKLTIDRN
jgi:hypothetical protein